MNKRKPSQTMQKPRSTKAVLKRMWKYLISYRKLLILIIFLTIISNVFALIGPYLSGLAINEIEKGKNNIDFEIIFKCCGLMIIFYLISAILSYVLSVIMIKMSQNIAYKMRSDVFNKLAYMPISFFDKTPTGDILSRISYDVDTVSTSIASDIIQISASIITVLGSFIMMLIISPLLSLVFVVTVPLSIIFTKFMSKRTRRLFRARSVKLGELNSFSEEMITGNKTIKAYAQEDYVIDKFDKVNIDTSKAAYEAEYHAAIIGPSVNFINNISLTLVSVFGALLYMKKRISLGNISSFVLYSRKFSGPINELANIISDLQSALAAAERVLDLIDSKIEEETAKEKIDLDVLGHIEGKNICFGYNPEREIIHNLSFEAKEKEVIAIVGPTGAGKTTIINLLMRFYDLNSGAIYLDENNIYDLYRSDVRKNYAMVLQDTWLFNGTILENVLYGSKNKTLEDAIEACKKCKIHSFIMKLPKGYDTILSDDGINISKGQKQLLTIARAFLLDAKMLILDEATSNVDTKTEIDIQNSMLNLMKDKTCFIIAHRLSTIINADLILVCKDGRIIEKGNHEELLIKKGFYYELYNSQFNAS